VENGYLPMYVDNSEIDMEISTSTAGDVSTVTKSHWFEKKLEENVGRRKAIANICSEMNSLAKELMDFSIERLVFSEKNMIAYCPVPKVATTTWTYFFLRTGNTFSLFFIVHDFLTRS
jgi:hypothetical protein